MRIITLLLIIFWLTSCAGQNDFSAKLVANYYIYRSSAHSITIGRTSGHSQTTIIPEKVLECDFDLRFIIARQQELQRRNPNNVNDTYMEPARGKYHYWIVDVQGPKIYGPLTQAQFSEQRKTLGVPESLTLKDVYTFRK